MGYQIKRFSSLTNETKTQMENRKNLATSIGGLTALAGTVGTLAHDANKYDKDSRRLTSKFKKAADKDFKRYDEIENKINKVSENLRSKAKGLGDYIRINRAEMQYRIKNAKDLDKRSKSSKRLMDRGSKLINKASNKRLAIGLGLSAAAGLGAAYGINKMAKNRNIIVNESRRNK